MTADDDSSSVHSPSISPPRRVGAAGAAAVVQVPRHPKPSHHTKFHDLVHLLTDTGCEGLLKPSIAFTDTRIFTNFLFVGRFTFSSALRANPPLPSISDTMVAELGVKAYELVPLMNDHSEYPHGYEHCAAIFIQTTEKFSAEDFQRNLDRYNTSRRDLLKEPRLNIALHRRDVEEDAGPAEQQSGLYCFAKKMGEKRFDNIVACILRAAHEQGNQHYRKKTLSLPVAPIHKAGGGGGGAGPRVKRMAALIVPSAPAPPLHHDKNTRKTQSAMEKAGDDKKRRRDDNNKYKSDDSDYVHYEYSSPKYNPLSSPSMVSDHEEEDDDDDEDEDKNAQIRRHNAKVIGKTILAYGLTSGVDDMESEDEEEEESEDDEEEEEEENAAPQVTPPVTRSKYPPLPLEQVSATLVDPHNKKGKKDQKKKKTTGKAGDQTKAPAPSPTARQNIRRRLDNDPDFNRVVNIQPPQQQPVVAAVNAAPANDNNNQATIATLTQVLADYQAFHKEAIAHKDGIIAQLRLEIQRLNANNTNNNNGAAGAPDFHAVVNRNQQ